MPISKNKTLQLPKYIVPNIAAPFTDFATFDWTGRLTTIANLNAAPIYGATNIAAYGGLDLSIGIQNFVITKPRTFIYIGNADTFVSVANNNQNNILKNHLTNGFMNRILPQTIYTLFPCTKSIMVNQQYYGWVAPPFTGPPTLFDFNLNIGAPLIGRFIGGDLLILAEVILNYITTENNFGGGGNQGFTCSGALNSFGILSGIITTAESDLINSMSILFNEVKNSFNSIKIIFRLYWNSQYQDQMGAYGGAVGSKIGLPAIQSEIDTWTAVFAPFNFITVQNHGVVANDFNGPVFSKDEIWSNVMTFFNVM